MRTRDSQRSKVYAAEQLFRERIDKEKQPELYAFAEDKLELEELQKLVNHLVSLAWFKRRWSRVGEIEVRAGGQGRTHACGVRVFGGGVVKLPAWSRTKLVTLHEVAHVCAFSLEAHGRRFCRTFIELVEHEAGYEAGKLLKKCMDEKRARWRKRYKRPDLKGKMPPFVKEAAKPQEK